MKVKVTKEYLLKAVQAAQNVVSAKTALPILTNILIEAENNKIKITATDLEIGMQYEAPAEVLLAGAITVPAKKFCEVVKELPNAPVLLTTLKNNTMSVNSESTYFKLLGLPKDDFPKVPQLPEENVLEVKQRTLKNMLAMTMFATSRDEIRYILNGILFSIKSQVFRLVATDGRRLALIENKTETHAKLERQAIVPNKAVQELSRMLQDDGTVKIIFAENQLMFKANDVILITRLIEGEFPNYEQVVPKESTNKIKVNTQRFLLGAKRAALLTSQDSQSIRIDLLKDKMVISKNTPEAGEAKDQLDILYAGKETSVGFNPHYLIDALKNISQQEIEMEIEGPDKAGVIRTQAEEKYIYLVLPMQLS